MKKLFYGIAILSFIFSYTSYSQQLSARDVIFFEAGGHGIIFSANYERFFSDNFAVRAGIGNALIYGTSYPLLFNYYSGEGNNKLELGAGIVYFAGKIEDGFFGNSDAALISGTIGLRYQKPRGGVVIRLSFTPMFNPGTNRILPMGGVSLGYAFH